MNINQLHTRDTFFKIVYEHPEGYEKDAKRADLNLSLYCRHCGKIVDRQDAGVIVGYWHPTWFIAHKSCEKSGKEDEAYHCQKIDADCNDCKHFKRGDYNKRFDKNNLLDPSKYALFTGQPEVDGDEQQRYIRDGLLVGSYDGHCLKFNKSTSAWPGRATMHECFEHRKD